MISTEREKVIASICLSLLRRSAFTKDCYCLSDNDVWSLFQGEYNPNNLARQTFYDELNTLIHKCRIYTRKKFHDDGIPELPDKVP